MQEVWELFQLSVQSEDNFDSSTPAGATSEQLFLAISHEAQLGASGRSAIQFLGTIDDITVTVLVDLGSSASFIAKSLADKLHHLQRVPMTATVKVANGHLLQCTDAIPGCQFFLSSYAFQHELRVLPPDSYDIILGMD